MKKIYSRSVFEFNPETGLYEVNDNESQYHYVDDDAPITEMKGGGGGGRVIQTTSQAPWAGQQPYLDEGFYQTRDQFLRQPPPDYFPGSSVVPFSPQTEESLQGTEARARAGSPLNRDAGGMLDRTLSGDYLYGGSGFNAALDAAKRSIIPGVESRFAMHGRSGSGLAREAEASAIGDKFAGLYGDERQRQMQAAELAPTIAGQDYTDLGMLGKVGMQREELSNEQLQDQMQRYDYSQNARRRMLEEYMGLIQGNYGGNTTSSIPQTGPQGWARYLLDSIGGGIKGGIAGAQFGPWGAAGGSIGGGVSGLLDAYSQ